MGAIVWVQNYVAYTAIDNNRPMLVCTQGGNKQTSIGRFACNEKEGTGLMLRRVCSCAHLFDVIDEGVRSGEMCDESGTTTERFPKRRLDCVRQKISIILAEVFLFTGLS